MNETFLLSSVFKAHERKIFDKFKEQHTECSKEEDNIHCKESKYVGEEDDNYDYHKFQVIHHQALRQNNFCIIFSLLSLPLASTSS